MYRISRERRTGSGTVKITNIATRSTIDIGRLTMDITEELKKEGYTFDDSTSEKYIDMSGNWSVEISKSTAEALASKALKMSKPLRTKIKTDLEVTRKKEVGSTVDAMDVLLGLASYK